MLCVGHSVADDILQEDLESVHHVHGSDSLALGMLCVGHSVADDILQEHLENPPSLLIDEARDPLNSTSAGQPPDGGLSDALDVVPQNLPVPLGSTLPQTLASLAAARHCALVVR